MDIDRYIGLVYSTNIETSAFGLHKREAHVANYNDEGSVDKIWPRQNVS